MPRGRHPTRCCSYKDAAGCPVEVKVQPRICKIYVAKFSPQLSPRMRPLLASLWQEWKHLEEQVESLSIEIGSICDSDPAYRRLRQHAPALLRELARQPAKQDNKWFTGTIHGTGFPFSKAQIISNPMEETVARELRS